MLGRLAGLAVYTSVGYVLYSLFLKEASVSVLMLGTYTGLLFAFRYFAQKNRYRFPRNLYFVSTSIFDVGYTLCMFGYWYFFWAGMVGLASSGSDASEIAISFLALNMVLMPISMHVVEGNTRNARLIFQFGAGIALVIAIFLININVSIEDLLKGNFGFDLETSSSDTSKSSNKYIYPTAIAYFLLAILLEAIADGFNKKKSMVTATPYGKDYLKREVEKLYARITRSWGRDNNTSLVFVLDVIEGHLRSIRFEGEREVENDKKILDEFLKRGSDENKEDIRILNRNIEAADRNLEYIDSELEVISKLRHKCIKENIELTNRKFCTEKKHELIEKYWSPCLEHCKAIDQVSSESSKFTNRKLKQTEILAETLIDRHPTELMVLVGFILSFILCFTDAHKLADYSVGYILFISLILVLLGFIGGSARALLINPMVMQRGSQVEEYVPPTYAIRPLIFFGLMYAVENFGVRDLLAQWNFTGVTELSEEQKEGFMRKDSWFLGIFIALAFAFWAYSMAYIPNRKSRYEAE